MIEINKDGLSEAVADHLSHFEGLYNHLESKAGEGDEHPGITPPADDGAGAITKALMILAEDQGWPMTSVLRTFAVGLKLAMDHARQEFLQAQIAQALQGAIPGLAGVEVDVVPVNKDQIEQLKAAGVIPADEPEAEGE